MFFGRPGEEDPPREEAGAADGQELEAQLRPNRARGDGEGGALVHAVPSPPPAQDVGGGADAGRRRTRGKMGGVAESRLPRFQDAGVGLFRPVLL